MAISVPVADDAVDGIDENVKFFIRMFVQVANFFNHFLLNGLHLLYRHEDGST